MRFGLLALFLGVVATSSVIVSSQEGMPDHRISWPAKSCLHVIEAKRWASDCQDTAVYRDMFWDDAYDTLLDGTRRDPRDAQLNGPCPKYRTYLREIEVGAVNGRRQSVDLKVITTRVNIHGQYSGDYVATKVSYVCERRDAEWRVLRRKFHSSEWFVNEDARQAFERSGAWGRNLEAQE